MSIFLVCSVIKWRKFHVAKRGSRHFLFAFEGMFPRNWCTIHHLTGIFLVMSFWALKHCWIVIIRYKSITKFSELIFKEIKGHQWEDLGFWSILLLFNIVSDEGYKEKSWQRGLTPFLYGWSLYWECIFKVVGPGKKTRIVKCIASRDVNNWISFGLCEGKYCSWANISQKKKILT